MFSIFKGEINIFNIIIKKPIKKRHKRGEAILVKSSKEKKLEDGYYRANHICPDCKRNQYESGNPVGGLTSWKYDYYTCNYDDCGAEWKVKK